MGLIKSMTGVMSTGLMTVSKSICSLYIESTEDFETMGATISIYIEGQNGSNVNLLSQFPLKHFVMMSTFGTQAVNVRVDNGTMVFLANCALTDEGSIPLPYGASLKIQVDGLNPVKVYDFYAVEELVEADYLNFYDRRVIITDISNQVIDVRKCDLILIDEIAEGNLNEIRVTADSGRQAVYQPKELRQLQLDCDPIYKTTKTGTIMPYVDKLFLLPVVGVKSVEIYKGTASALSVGIRESK